MRTTILAILGCLCSGFAAADPAASSAIEAASSREGVSLHGEWRSIVDPYEAGYYNHAYKPQPDGGFAANKKPQSKSQIVEYDFDTSPQLQVPGDWNTQRPELMFYEGTVWYKRDFDYHAKPGRRQFIWFGAANYQAIVFLNGVRLGEHIGGFTPFQFEVTGHLKEQGNFLIVKVDDQRHAEAVPTLQTDWWNYGGLTRDVRIIDVPDTFVEDYLLQLAKGSQSHVAGWVRLDGPRKRQKVTIRIPRANVVQEVSTDENGYAPIAFDARFDLWSPAHPVLYDVTIESGSDKVTERIGFRSIEALGPRILVNGQPIFLRGVSIHAESPFHAARLYSEADARTLLGWAKEMGCNFVRLPHYPHDEVMTKVADEMGLLVWSEIPVYWAIEWENAETFRNASQQLADTIGRDKNRASVILWSVANETPRGDARLKFLTGLVDRAHQLDSTRLVTAATETHKVGHDTIMIDDPLGKVLDVVSCNEYVGWYDGPPAKIDAVQWKNTFDNKPFVISEFGAGAQAGRHGDDMTAWTEEFQGNVYRRQVAMFKRMPFLNGTIAWVLVDFRSPRRMLTDIQDFYNRKGLVSDHGEKKEAFYILRDFYRSMEQVNTARSR